MKTEMVERVAWALWEEVDAGAPWEQLGPWARERWAQKARAAIRALMEPTEEMQLAGIESPGTSYCDRCMQQGHALGSGDPTAVYQAMLTAALGEDR